MISTPFLLFSTIGIILQSDLDYLIKIIAFAALYAGVYTANNYIYDERLYFVLPMSIYLATKVNENISANLDRYEFQLFFSFGYM